MIPRVGDKVNINPEFVKRWIHCRGGGIPLPAHQYKPPADTLLNTMVAFGVAVLTIRRTLANSPDPAKASTLVEFGEVPGGIWLDPQGRYIDCLRCCSEFDADPCPFATTLVFEPFFLAAKRAPQAMSATALKMANTKPDAGFCASCGSQLKDPGMGPLYKHCPRCEP
jgi:hypothetical protein